MSQVPNTPYTEYGLLPILHLLPGYTLIIICRQKLILFLRQSFCFSTMNSIENINNFTPPPLTEDNSEIIFIRRQCNWCEQVYIFTYSAISHIWGAMPARGRCACEEKLGLVKHILWGQNMSRFQRCYGFLE